MSDGFSLSSITNWTEDAIWTYIGRSEVALDVSWTYNLLQMPKAKFMQYIKLL